MLPVALTTRTQFSNTWVGFSLSGLDRKDPFLRVLTLGAWIRRNIDADHSHASSRIDHAYTVLQYLGWVFFVRIMIAAGLVAYRIDGAIHAFHFLLARPQALLDSLVLLAEIEDLFDWIVLAEIDRGRSKFL